MHPNGGWENKDDVREPVSEFYPFIQNDMLGQAMKTKDAFDQLDSKMGHKTKMCHLVKLIYIYPVRETK